MFLRKRLLTVYDSFSDHVLARSQIDSASGVPGWLGDALPCCRQLRVEVAENTTFQNGPNFVVWTLILLWPCWYLVWITLLSSRRTNYSL